MIGNFMAKPSSIVCLCCFEMKDIRIIIILHEKRLENLELPGNTRKFFAHLDLPGELNCLLFYLEIH